jgi:tRNA-specific 2-thiouridylase
MLARLDPRHLDRLWFPLGEQSKEETRAEAERAGLSVARRAESQEACFLGGADYREFLERQGLPARAGRLVDEVGETVGHHNGFWRFTPGQRRGLGVSAGRPVYALGGDPATNTVVVGSRESLARRTVVASGHLFASVTRGDAKLRYRSPALPADVEATEDGFRLLFDEPAYGVAAGQTAVVYEGDAVVGSGTIASSAA